MNKVLNTINLYFAIFNRVIITLSNLLELFYTFNMILSGRKPPR